MIELQEKFSHLTPFTFGPDDHKQFYKQQGEIFCLRKACDGCKYKEECSFKEKKLEVEPIPNVRRALAVENIGFLLLKPNLDPKDIPVLTKDQLMSFYHSNLHFVLQKHGKGLFVIKGQARYYGSIEEFNSSEYSKYFSIIKIYKPKQRLYSLDYSAIEPRLAALVTREPKWKQVFAGSPKIIAKEVEIPTDNHPSYIVKQNNKTYCYLTGELDKAEYIDQCNKCPFQNSCKIITSFKRNVAGDFHAENAIAFYREKFTEEKDKYTKKDLRAKAKAGGLAVMYNSYEKTLALTLGVPVDVARVLRENFLSALPVVQDYMDRQKKTCKRQRYVANIFNRSYNLEAILTNPKIMFRADAIALNHPIQSLGADFLKYGMIKSQDYIRNNGLNAFSSVELDNGIDLNKESDAALVASVHDEVVFAINDEKANTLIPNLYYEMRLDFMMDKFQAGFYLELDSEYDEYRSWTSSSKFDTGKIFLLRELGLEESTSSIKNPSIYLVDIKDLTHDLIDSIVENSQEDGFLLGIRDNDNIHISEFKIKNPDSSNIKGLKFQPAFN